MFCLRWCKVYTKTNPWFHNLRQTVENPKTWNLMGYFCPKNWIPSAKTLYTEDLSHITFNYLCKNSPNYLSHFWSHKSFFIFHFFSWIITNFLWKCNFSDFPRLALKFTKFLMSFLEKNVSSPSNFASLFSVMRHNSSVLFLLNLYTLCKKVALEVQISRLSTVCMKINQIPYFIFQATSQFYLKFCITLQCSEA